LRIGNSTFDAGHPKKIESMTLEKKKKEEVVLVGHRMCRGGVGLQRCWWRMTPFSSLRILPFELVSENSDWWVL